MGPCGKVGASDRLRLRRRAPWLWAVGFEVRRAARVHHGDVIPGEGFLDPASLLEIAGGPSAPLPEFVDSTPTISPEPLFRPGDLGPMTRKRSFLMMGRDSNLGP